MNRRRGRSQWWALFVLIALTMGAWSAASPLFSYPDESAHVIKAEAVVRGQLVGQNLSRHEARKTTPSYRVRVPGALQRAGVSALCYGLDAELPASCAPPVEGPDHPVEVSTYVGNYPPLYYLLVGWPSLISPGAPGIYAMRAASVVLNAAFLASAFASMLVLRRRRIAVLGVAVAATPLVVYLSGSVNPSSLETTSAIALWASSLALVTRSAFSLRLLTRSGVAAVVLVSMRGVSPLWLAVIALAVLAVAGRQRAVELARLPAVRFWAVPVGVATAFAIWWDVAVGTAQVMGAAVGSSTSNATIVATSFGQTWGWTRQAIAVFGFLNVGVLPSVAIWLVAALGLAVSALLFGWTRARMALLAVGAATILVPVAFTVAVDRTYGPIWQGRYTLPLSVGVAVLAGVALSGTRHRFARPLTTHAWAFLGALAFAEVFALLVTLRRFMVGTTGSWAFLGGPWQPPVPPLAILLVAAGAEAVLMATLYHVGRADGDDGRRSEARAGLSLCRERGSTAQVACWSPRPTGPSSR